MGALNKGLPVKLTKEQIQNGFLPPGNVAGAISGLGNAMRVRRTPRTGKPERESKGEGAVRDAASPGDGQSANREGILNPFLKRVVMVSMHIGQEPNCRT